MSGFVYTVTVDGQTLIKKEIPGPETIDEFLYEINALNSLRYSDNVIKFYGLVVDEFGQVKGLLISYADGGALIDIIYDNCKAEDTKSNGILWSLKERWARQIVHGLADVHECGYVQGDFTLSNIVIDEYDNAKIIDINRRGCPVGWEPPEATPLIESQHRISMYIGVKSDLYQLGMVLWAIAMDEDEPEREGRPLSLGSEAHVPEWYRQITEICLSADPRKRLQASMLLQLFPPQEPIDPCITVDDGHEVHDLNVNEFHPDGHPRIRIENLPRQFWSPERSYSPGTHPAQQSWHYAPRGRSPPSPMPSNYDESKSPGRFDSRSSWAANRAIRASYSDAGGDEARLDEIAQHFTPNTSVDRGPLPTYDDFEDKMPTMEDEQVTPAATATDNVEKEMPNPAGQPQSSEMAVGESSQATPTQGTIDTGADTDVKDDEHALQEITGNVTKLPNPPETPEESVEVEEGLVAPHGSDETLRQESDTKEKEAPLATASHAPKPKDIIVAADAGSREDVPTELAVEKLIAEEKELGEKPPPQATADGEVPAPVNHSAEGAMESAPEPKHEPEKTATVNGEPEDPLPPVNPEANAEEANSQAPGSGDAQQIQVVSENVELAHADIDLPTHNDRDLKVEHKEEAGKSEQDDQAAGEMKSDAQQSVNDASPVQETVPSNDDTETIPTATTEPIAAMSETQAQDGTSAPSETQIEISPDPLKDNATPRISPSLPQGAMVQSDPLVGIGGGIPDDHFMQGKDLAEEDFQLVDRPPETVPTFVITTDTTT